MTTLTLDCGTNDLVVNASLSSITLQAGSLLSVSGPVKFSSLVSGIASFDASGNISAVAGSTFNTASSYTVSGAWVFSNTATHSAAVQINSTLTVVGNSSLTGVLTTPSLATIASSVAIPSFMPPTGWSYLVVNNSSGEHRRLT